MDVSLEQKTLKLSIATTLVVAGLGVGFGLLSGSHSILFDGVFSSIDAAMSLLALLVSKLVARESTRRFQLGYWHFEPMAAALNGAILLLLCFYAFLNALSTLLQGGNPLAVDMAIGYSLIVCVICYVMVFVERRLNRQARSDFVKIDIQNWLMAALITSALLVAFAAALVMQGTALAPWIPYVDSTLLVVLTLGFMPVPAGIVYRAMREVLMMAPSRLDREVREAMAPVMQRPGLERFESYVAKTGRVHNIEIHIVTTPDFASGSGIAELDRIREEIAEGLSIPAEQRWFTVSFTADPRWL
ncbi:cation transporter [Salinicola sp. LHM]|uniref:cation diffusion facilitator family transporter n=1 Tax=Salinicola TaxID=404432 RepID=UPI000DA18527|nr:MULTISPECIES: cation transporter [Salinicola]MDF3919164.1 cation transporter [Salinicola salarius]WQH31922.1 cation transporter [Salinicola sp. LHM]